MLRLSSVNNVNEGKSMPMSLTSKPSHTACDILVGKQKHFPKKLKQHAFYYDSVMCLFINDINLRTIKVNNVQKKLRATFKY